MNEEEMEEIVSKLNQRINKNSPNFTLDNKTKKILKNLNFFRQILAKYPDKGENLMTEIISNLYIRKYNQFEIIWDDNKKYLNGIFIVLQGVVNVYLYNFQNKSKSNETNLHVMIKKVKTNNNNIIQSKLTELQNKNSNSIIEDLKPLKIDFVAKKGDSIGNTFLKNIYKNNRYKNIYKKIDISYEENKENKDNNDNKYFYKLESKTKSIVAFLTEEDYNIIFNKIVTRERHERINFLHDIHYMPRDQDFIERFQNHIIKRCFKKNTTIFKQNDDFQTFYIIMSGSARLSINFNRQFFCSLDFDVLIGKLINDRFTSSRVFEIIGNYREKENFIVIDLGEGEILGGIEFYKNINNYIFTCLCITDVILYEINIKYFKNILSYWSFHRFYEKIENQITYFKNRILSINNFRKEKYKKDDYSFSQNKFILTYKRGHPISAKKESYIKKYTNPFKFEKILKSKKLKVNNTSYINLKEIQKIKNRNETQNDNISGKKAFITNIPKKIKRGRKAKKSKTMMHFKFKFKKRKWTEEIEDMNEEKKDNIKYNINGEKDNSCNKKMNKVLNNALDININNKNFRRFNDRRLKSCKIENKIKSKINSNLFENKSINSKNKNNTTKTIPLISTNKIKINKYSVNSVETINKNKSNSEIMNIIYQNYNNRNIKKRNNNLFGENLTDDSNKNISENLKVPNSAKKDYLIYNKLITPLNKEYKNISHPHINHKSVSFPSGVKEINNLKLVKINELLPSFISNSYIRNELKIKKVTNINAFLLRHNNSKLKIK